MKRTEHKFFKACAMTILGLIAVLLIVQPVLAEETSTEGWKFSADFYGWLPDIKADLVNGGQVEITLKDIINNLDFTFMGGLSARKGKLSFLVDVVYMKLDHNTNNTVGQIPDFLRLSLNNVQMTSWIVTPVVAYTVLETEHVNLDILTGLSYFYLKNELEFKLQTPAMTEKFSESASNGYWNGLVGVKGNVLLNEKWYLPFSGNVGTGDTDLNWEVFGGVGYKFAKLDLVAGYRHMQWDFDSGDIGGEVFKNLRVSGPLVGVRYYF